MKEVLEAKKFILIDSPTKYFLHYNHGEINVSYEDFLNIIEAKMIEFAKGHVDEALRASHKNMQLPEEDLEFTLSCYPLENIK